jgi:hypothetical protein
MVACMCETKVRAKKAVKLGSLPVLKIAGSATVPRCVWFVNTRQELNRDCCMKSDICYMLRIMKRRAEGAPGAAVR